MTIKRKLYFKSKHSDGQIFSSEIFDKVKTGVSLMNCKDFFLDDNRPVHIKKYYNMNDILNDIDNFTILTDANFTKSELKMIQDLVYAHGRHIYGVKKVMNLVNKIEQLLMTKCYLPDNKDEIINK